MLKGPFLLFHSFNFIIHFYSSSVCQGFTRCYWVFACICVLWQFGKEWFKPNWLLFIEEESIKSQTAMDCAKFITRERSQRFFICTQLCIFIFCFNSLTPCVFISANPHPLHPFRPSICLLEWACIWPRVACVGCKEKKIRTELTTELCHACSVNCWFKTRTSPAQL